MRSESQKKADKKYIKNKTTMLIVKLINSTDSDVISKLQAVPNKSGYVKKLIREDIYKQKKQC